MAREYIKAVIESKEILCSSESCEDIGKDPVPSDSNHSMGLRSPGGPLRGRSVKEFEEQLANLKKENFNLKLRIYFLEERMGSNFNLDKENVVKKNVELMVEIESLRKEVQEKHDLLCQAVKAMELEDEEHKKLVSEKEEVISDYQLEIENLKMQLLDLKPESGFLSPKSYQSDSAEPLLSAQTFNIVQQAPSNAMKDLQEKIRLLEEELTQEKENNAAIQLVLDQTGGRIKNLSSQLDEANKKISLHEGDIRDMSFRLEETNAKCQSLQKKLQEKAQIVDEMSNENDQLRKRQAILVVDLERERKRYEKLKVSSDQKASDLQCKLEASLTELKKSQELVVSKSSARRTGNTDDDSFLVQKPTTPPRSPQKDPFLYASVSSSPLITPTSSPSPSVSFSVENGVDLRHVIEQLKSERDVHQQKIVKLKAEQMKACKIIKSMIDSRNKANDEIAALKQRNEELEKELEGVVYKFTNEGSKSSNSKRNENSMDESQNGELIEHYKALTDELEEKNRILMQTLSEKDSQMKRIREQYQEIVKTYKQKEDQIVDLEFELLSAAQDKSQKNEEESEEQGAKNADFYAKLLQSKEEEIERLNAKLEKRNHDLQGLVNNELWEKNRQIEKLQKLQTEGNDREIEKLQNDLKTKEYQFNIIKEKISELGIEIDLQSGGVSVENNLQVELEKSEKLRFEANEVCGVLSRRLEELAVFLDSLLRQKSVLGFLGNKENKRLRQIIDQSLDLSRSFTMSMIINPEQSLLQLTNISSLLDDTQANEDEASRLSMLPSNISLTYQSHLYKKEEGAQIIQALRQQIVNLKYELQLRDVELSKIDGACAEVTEVSSEKEGEDAQKSALNTTSTTLKCRSDQSESEAWSEPDRSVSRVRIGLLDGSLRSNSSKKLASNASTDSTEEEGASPRSRKSVLSESRATILDLHKQICELDQKLVDKEMAFCEAIKTNTKLKQELDNFEIRFKSTEEKVLVAESRKIEAEARAKQLKKEKDELLESLTRKDRELQNKINQIEVEKVQALDIAREAQEAVEAARNDMRMAEMKLKAIQAEIRNEYEDKLLKIENETLKKIKQIQNSAETEIKSLHETIQQIQLEYSTNYVKKCQVEEAFREIDSLKNEIESLEERIEEMSCEEQRLKNQVAEYEEKINCLRDELDHATLQYSEAVLEKTKITNEKANIEQELSKNILKEIDAKKRLDEVENEAAALKQNHQKQISSLQMIRSKLEVRVSELESSNAELHNKLIKIQAGCGDHLSTSLPNTPNFVNQIVSFRRQHSENSSYLSEDNLLDDLRAGRNFGRLLPNPGVDIERNEANSSPDLGIESDHGRFSSLETHMNVQRPLLQTLELTESMNNLLDVENNPVQEMDCDNSHHCCQRTIEMAHENTDLKRKLLRTRRALEETVTQLTLANQRKKQVEKTICKQIHKTSQVLRKAKANLDSGSETDVYKK